MQSLRQQSFLLGIFLVISATFLQPIRADLSKRRFQYPTKGEDLLRPEWQRDFVREVRNFTGTKRTYNTLCYLILEDFSMAHLDLQYLQNHSQALMGFYDWYLADNYDAFGSMLRREHKISCLGKNGKTPYTRIHLNGTYDSRFAHPGKMRRDLVDDDELFLSRDQFQLSSEEIKLLVQSGQPWASAFAKDPKATTHRIQVRGVQEKYAPILKIARTGDLERDAPSGAAETEFELASSARMEDLKKYRNFSHTEVEARLDSFLDDMADYYHTIINWMPFSRVNNSLFMGQENVLFRHFQFNTLEHDRLDYLALSSDYLVFRKIFKESFLN